MSARLGMSRPGSYRLSEPDDGVREVILARRRDRALAMPLSDPDSHRALGQLARRHDVPSAAAFSRPFAARFGMDPGRSCELIRDGDPAWLAAQHERAGFTPEPMVGHRRSKRSASSKT